MQRPAFGHTGFTGTSIWIDPEHDLYIVLLTNRVNPTRANQKIGAVRVSVADAAMRALAPAAVAAIEADSAGAPRSEGPSMNLSAIDWAIVAAYFALSTGIGLVFTKKGGESSTSIF